MARILSLILTILIVSCGASSDGKDTNQNTERIGDPKINTLLIPLYSYPSGDYASEWDRLLNYQTDEETDVIVIVNPSSGPGTARDEVFSEIIGRLKERGFKAIGYFHTSYGGRSVSEVYADIDRWLEFYPEIDGFFIDEVSENNADYYGQVIGYIRSKFPSALVVGNPGTYVDPALFNLFDKIVIAEMSYQDFMSSSPPYDYEGVNPADKCVIVHSVRSEEEFYNAKNRALSMNISCAYITGDSYDYLHYFRLSPYLDLLVR